MKKRIIKKRIIRNKHGYDCNLNKKYGVELGIDMSHYPSIKNNGKPRIFWNSWKRYYTFSSALQAYLDLTRYNGYEHYYYRVVEIIYDSKDYPGFYSNPLEIKSLLLRKRKLNRILKKSI